MSAKSCTTGLRLVRSQAGPMAKYTGRERQVWVGAKEELRPLSDDWRRILNAESGAAA